jgi:hypothetical protein
MEIKLTVSVVGIEPRGNVLSSLTIEFTGTDR